jgi:hypothetical protein
VSPRRTGAVAAWKEPQGSDTARSAPPGLPSSTVGSQSSSLVAWMILRFFWRSSSKAARVAAGSRQSNGWSG